MTGESLSQYKSVRLTAKLVAEAKPGPTRYTIRDTGVVGLMLRVPPTGNKVWFLDYRDRENTRRSFKIGSAKSVCVSDARDAAMALLGAVARGEDPSVSRDKAKEQKRVASKEKRQAQALTLERYFNDKYYPLQLAGTKAATATEKAIRYVWGSLLEKDIRKITLDDVEAIEQRRIAEGISPATRKRDRVRLKAIINFALDRGDIDRDPLIRWKAPAKADRRIDRWLGQYEGEVERFMAALGNQPEDIRLIITLAIHCGCRKSEIFHLTWGDVDLINQKIHLRAEVTKSSKPRTIPLNTQALSALKAWRGDNVVHMPTALVVPAAKGKPRFSIDKAWRALCWEAKVEQLRLHDLRHTFASRLIQNGVPVIEVQNLLGHADLATTQRYSHHDPDSHRSAVQTLEVIFGG